VGISLSQAFYHRGASVFGSSLMQTVIAVSYLSHSLCSCGFPFLLSINGDSIHKYQMAYIHERYMMCYSNYYLYRKHLFSDSLCGKFSVSGSLESCESECLIFAQLIQRVDFNGFVDF
jgi:hypothetical protein